MLSLNRFDKDNQGFKLEDLVNFPLVNLDLGRDIKHDQLKRMVDNRKPPFYDPCGVINHMGSLRGGHYTSSCLNSESKRWFNYNDS